MSPLPRTLFAAGLAVSICAVLGLGSNANAAEKSVTIAVTAVDIVQQVDPSDGLSHDFLSIKGSITNSGTDNLTETVRLITGRPIATRSGLADLITSHSAAGLTSAPTEPMPVFELGSGSTRSWSFIERADSLWGTSASGVFPIGAASSDDIASDVVAIPWFGNTQQLSPTRITAAVVLSSTKHISDEQNAQEIISSEVERLSVLTSGALNDQSFIVDSYVLDLLAKSDSDQAQKTATQVSLLQSAASVYGNSNLARLNAGNQQAAIKRALALTPNTGTVLYLPNSANPSLDSFGARLDSIIIPVVTNTVVTGDKNATVDARATTSTQHALVADQGVGECLTLKTAFAAQWCLSSQLGMITAESPNVSRNVLLVAPTSWSPNLETVSAVSHALQSTQGYKNESLTSLLRSNAVTTVKNNAPTTKSFDSAVRRVERDVLRAQKSLENVFGETDVSASLAGTAALMYSHNWKTASAAKHFGRSHVQQAHEILNQLALEGSKHITIPGTKADLPITVFNSSPFTAHVQVIVNGTGANRLTAEPSQLVAVEPGSRVTVQIPITLNSAGDVQAVAYLADSTGNTFGDSLSIQIASTAYQQFARSLVWVALTALILLVGNNVWRRTRSTNNDGNA